jgi:hypothetical protein
MIPNENKVSCAFRGLTLNRSEDDLIMIKCEPGKGISCIVLVRRQRDHQLDCHAASIARAQSLR